MTDHNCGIGIWSIFDAVFRYLPIFLTVLRYWISSNVPLFPRISKQENADTTNTSNPPEGEIENQEPLNTDQSESPSILQALNTLSENPATIPRPTAERTDTSSESSHSSDTEESEESLYQDTPLTSVTKRPRKLFQNEKEGSSDHLEYDDFIPDYSTDRSSSEENIADFDDEMDASTLQGLQQTIIELQ